MRISTDRSRQRIALAIEPVEDTQAPHVTHAACVSARGSIADAGRTAGARPSVTERRFFRSRCDGIDR
jgi:hypothetical protein